MLSPEHDWQQKQEWVAPWGTSGVTVESELSSLWLSSFLWTFCFNDCPNFERPITGDVWINPECLDGFDSWVWQGSIFSCWCQPKASSVCCGLLAAGTVVKSFHQYFLQYAVTIYVPNFRTIQFNSCHFTKKKKKEVNLGLLKKKSLAFILWIDSSTFPSQDP